MTALALRQALALLQSAGYVLQGMTLRNRSTGQQLSFEIMVANRDDERLAIAFAHNLGRAGIDAKVRLVDDVQYQQRLLSFDFDMIEFRWEQSLSPGNEQSFYFGSAAADEQGSRDYMGVRSPAVDAMIAALLKARGRAEFVDAVRALDRVLISGCYVVPLFYLPEQWVARWAYVEHPAQTSLFGYLPETWWRTTGNAGAAMILGDPASAAIAAPQGQRRASLDEVFHRIAQRQPDMPALIDPPNRAAFTDGAPRRLTYAQAERADRRNCSAADRASV